jgi:hypothetical protein
MIRVTFFCWWFQSRQQIAILSDGLLQSTNRVFQLHENLLQCHEDLRQTREDLLRGKDNFRVIINTALGVHVYDMKQKKESSGGEVNGSGGGGVGAGGGGAGGVGADGLYGTVNTNLRGWSGGTISENVWHHSIPVGNERIIIFTEVKDKLRSWTISSKCYNQMLSIPNLDKLLDLSDLDKLRIT